MTRVDAMRWALALTLTVSCAPDAGPNTGPVPVCNPGEADVCACSTGTGSRTCNSTGTGYSGCFCPSGCTPNCVGRTCGRDGCDNGGLCGSCGAGLSCDENVGACVPTTACTPGMTIGCACSGGSTGTQTCFSDGSGYDRCVCPTLDAGTADVPATRNCTGRECGPDGAGGSCGTCPLAGWACNAVGRCVSPDQTCRSMCSGRQCGPDPGQNCAGQSCGTCAAGSTCSSTGQCVCTRRCSGRECGSDGCGGSCGTCAVGRSCNEATGLCSTTSCASACFGRMCGPDPGAGCSGRTCGTCPGGYACNASGTGCLLDANSLWVVTAVSGTVSGTAPDGSAWDVDGSAPDPVLCLTINGTRLCTMAAPNTYTPRWNAVFPATRASALLAGVRSEYFDEDVTVNDAICAAGTIRFTEAQLTAGAPVTFRCDPYGSFTLSLRAQ